MFHYRAKGLANKSSETLFSAPPAWREQLVEFSIILCDSFSLHLYHIIKRHSIWIMATKENEVGHISSDESSCYTKGMPSPFPKKFVKIYWGWGMGSFGTGMMHTPLDKCPWNVRIDRRHRNVGHRIWRKLRKRTGLGDDCLRRKEQTFSSKTDKISPNRNRF